MSGSIGDLLGEGRTAAVYHYGEGKAIKLMFPGLSDAVLRDEAMKTASAKAAGAPAPRVYGIEEVDGRSGLVMDIAEGTPLIDAILGAPHRARHWGRRLAEVHTEVLSHESAQLPDVRDTLAEKISRATPLSPAEKSAADRALEKLPHGTSVLHGDFHPLNVYLGNGATVIDWLDACSGPIEADLARSFWLTSTRVIPPDFPRRWAVAPVAALMGGSYRSHVMRLTRRTRDDIRPWQLPVLAGRLSEEIEHEEEALVREVRRLIRG